MVQVTFAVTVSFLLGVLLISCHARDKCLEHEFQCANGECIEKSKACDDHINCLDLSDERQVCRSLLRDNCAWGMVKRRFSDECISGEWICDGTNDCPDHSDEVPCKSTEDDSGHTWSDMTLLDPPRLDIKRINETFEQFGLHVAKKMKSLGVLKALVVERLINEVIFMAQLGFIDEDSFFCNSKGKPIFK